MVTIKEILKELENANSNTKQCAIIWELGNMGSNAEKASGKLSDILKKDTDWRRRTFAAWSLGRIGGKKAQKTLENITKRKEEDEIVQHGAKWALYWLKVKLASVPTDGPCTLEELKALAGNNSEIIPEF
ncbi:MAG: HEAT repeat domain-containing protein [Candidatus Heimdallarchaeota archaeon]